MKNNATEPLNGKVITKISWSNDGSTGIKVHFETDDGYVITYLLGFWGDLVHEHTRYLGNGDNNRAA